MELRRPVSSKTKNEPKINKTAVQETPKYNIADLAKKYGIDLKKKVNKQMRNKTKFDLIFDLNEHFK